MVDIADLPGGPWATLIVRVDLGERIEPQEVIDLLRSSEPVPDYARTFLADVIEGKHKFTQGVKPPKKLGTRWWAEVFRDAAKQVIAKERKQKESKRGESAKSLAVEDLNIGVRQLERRIKKLSIEEKEELRKKIFE